MSRLSLSLVFLWICLLGVPVSAADALATPPNFVIIFIDDMGYGDIGPFGSTLNRTPHLDQMAREGLKLTSFYAAPVCSASRAQLLTGCYAPRVSVPGVFFPAGPKGLNPKEHTIADYLQELDYATMCVGKWHLGDQPEFLPTRQGFDGYFGIPYSNDMGRPTIDGGPSVHPLMRDEEVAELLENEGQRRITREYTQEAIRFIEAHQQQPFFLYMPHTAMHVPLFPSHEFTGRSKNGTYGDWVEEVDWSVGQILATLERLKLSDNTLVIFTTDNGPWASKGENGGVSGPLRGSKGCTLEGGVRVPTLLKWPGKIPPGTVNYNIVGTTDVLPTLVELAGGTLHEDVKIDGISFAHLIDGAPKGQVRDEWFYFQGTELQAIRSNNWKLAVTPQTLGMGIKERPADLKSQKPRLYNLTQEIGELTDLSADYPRVVAKLQRRLAAMRADIGSGQAGPGVRPAGHVENPVTLFPTQPRKRNQPQPAPKTHPIDWQKVKIGDSYASSVAPEVGLRGLTISAKVDLEQHTGVIVSHGGSVVGYSLYAADEQLVFAIRASTEQVVRVKHLRPQSGSHWIRAELSSTGELRLQIDDHEAVVSKGTAQIPHQPREPLTLGFDGGNPVDPDSPDGRFKGKLESIVVTTRSE